MQLDVVVRVKIFDDAVHSSVSEGGFSTNLGWHRDEVDAVAAACEHELIASAILPTMRRLPEMRVECDYCGGHSGHVPHRMKRGTRKAPGGKTVKVPWASTKHWL